jgi:hypothetical protein
MKPNIDQRTMRGGAMMELAVVVPLLLVTFVGLVDFGRAAFEAIEVENAAHAGASWGSRTKGYAADAEGIRTAALADIGDDVDVSGVSVESQRYCVCEDGSDVDCDGKCSGELPEVYVRVRVDKQFETFLDYPGIANTIDIGREVLLRVR